MYKYDTSKLKENNSTFKLFLDYKLTSYISYNTQQGKEHEHDSRSSSF